MSFDITKYCSISDVVQQKSNKILKYNHDGLNIFYLVSGNCKVECHGQELEFNQNMIVCCDGPVVFTPVGECYLEGFNINGIIAEKYAKEVDTAFITSDIFMPFLPQQVMQIVESFDSLSEVYISNISFEILSALSSGTKNSIIASQTIVDAVKLIKENYSHVYGVEELSTALSISKSHLVREFYKHTGTTPGKYITSVRIDAVKQLLTSTNLTLSEIAERTGFSGDNYLCKSFKKTTGETPMAYRARVISSQYLPNQLTLQLDPDYYV